MKATIYGQVYDTESSDKFGEWNFQLGKIFWSERTSRPEYKVSLWQSVDALYCVRETGKFFMHRIASPDLGGEKIIPISWEAARDWRPEPLY